jgi:hypothetical protein
VIKFGQNFKDLQKLLLLELFLGANLHQFVKKKGGGATHPERALLG